MQGFFRTTEDSECFFGGGRNQYTDFHNEYPSELAELTPELSKWWRDSVKSELKLIPLGIFLHCVRESFFSKIKSTKSEANRCLTKKPNRTLNKAKIKEIYGFLTHPANIYSKTKAPVLNLQPVSEL